MESNLMKQLDSLEKNGLAFFHAPFFHNLVGEVREVRQRLGIRTVFNVLGPLLYPNTKLKYQLVGLYHEPVMRLYAETLQLLGREHALVVRGNDGLDEISICDEIKIVEGLFEQLDNRWLLFLWWNRTLPRPCLVKPIKMPQNPIWTFGKFHGASLPMKHDRTIPTFLVQQPVFRFQITA